jgi:citrate lyase beta subunit
MIETPKGVQKVDDIAAAHERVSTLVMGTSDLSRDLRSLHTRYMPCMHAATARSTLLCTLFDVSLMLYKICHACIHTAVHYTLWSILFDISFMLCLCTTAALAVVCSLS